MVSTLQFSVRCKRLDVNCDLFDIKVSNSACTVKSQVRKTIHHRPYRLLNQSFNVVFDNEVAVVGTYNFDPVSFRSNLEIVAVVHDEAFSESLAGRLNRDISENCKQIQGNEQRMDWPKQLGDLMVLAVERAVNIVLRRITNIS